MLSICFVSKGVIGFGGANSLNLLTIQAYDRKEILNKSSPFQQILSSLRRSVLSMPKPPAGQRISERHWLHSATRVWKEIQTGSLVVDYKKLMERTLIEGQYGKLNG